MLEKKDVSMELSWRMWCVLKGIIIIIDIIDTDDTVRLFMTISIGCC